MRIEDDKFRVFVSHKHQDHELAETIKRELGNLGTDPEIDCFVSGVDIAAGTDWNRTIKRELARSHLLLLLFTNPAHDWDWCLYEAGLFTQFDRDEVQAVVALFDENGQPPRPISNLQGVVATKNKLTEFIGRLCEKPWLTTDDWRRGAITGRRTQQRRIQKAAETISAEFARVTRGGRAPQDDAYYPCHRVVLELEEVRNRTLSKIPRDARVVVEGPRATSDYTLSLFGTTREGNPTWGKLVDLVNGRKARWRRELDTAFELAQQNVLFAPVTAGFCARDPEDQERRRYVPQLYRILRSNGRVVGMTIVMDRRLGTG